MQTKMVDLGIYIVSCPDLDHHIQCYLQPLPAGQQFVNQIITTSAQRNPYAVSLEAKVPFIGGQTSNMQLSVWVGAALSRLRQIVKPSHVQAGEPRKALRVLPALIAYGRHLDLVAFEEQVDRNVGLLLAAPMLSPFNLYGAQVADTLVRFQVICGKLSLSSSYTLLGVFQMIRGIEILARRSGKITGWRGWLGIDWAPPTLIASSSSSSPPSSSSRTRCQGPKAYRSRGSEGQTNSCAKHNSRG